MAAIYDTQVKQQLDEYDIALKVIQFRQSDVKKRLNDCGSFCNR